MATSSAARITLGRRRTHLAQPRGTAAAFGPGRRVRARQQRARDDRIRRGSRFGATRSADAPQVGSLQPVVERGPYRWIRHPSYAGADLALLGIGFCSGHWLPAALFVVPWMAAHAYRIQVEERALLATLGDPYARYRERTWRMVPLIW
ncbi:MAG: isoprenylcysteine carboxylmethyltransferase family protein [Deltaproteobacteria bacterium]|nr:MAG: isoprenylcysteine carboxylmethyltransferase family protein [Deltaproteobacteria bacterium]